MKYFSQHYQLCVFSYQPSVHQNHEFYDGRDGSVILTEEEETALLNGGKSSSPYRCSIHKTSFDIIL